MDRENLIHQILDRQLESINKQDYPEIFERGKTSVRRQLIDPHMFQKSAEDSKKINDNLSILQNRMLNIQKRVTHLHSQPTPVDHEFQKSSKKKRLNEELPPSDEQQQFILPKSLQSKQIEKWKGKERVRSKSKSRQISPKSARSKALQQQIRRQQQDLNESVKSIGKSQNKRSNSSQKNHKDPICDQDKLRKLNLQQRKVILQLQIKVKRLQEQNQRLMRKQRKNKAKAEKAKEIVQDYQTLVTNFQKSQKIRNKQKLLIVSLKEQLSKR